MIGRLNKKIERLNNARQHDVEQICNRLDEIKRNITTWNNVQMHTITNLINEVNGYNERSARIKALNDAIEIIEDSQNMKA